MKSRLIFISFALPVFFAEFAVGQHAALGESSSGREPSARFEGEDRFGKDYFQRAVALFNGGSFEEAAEYFRMAYEARRNYKMLYNIGQAEMSAKRYGLALEAFERYISIGGNRVPEDRRGAVLGEIELLRRMVGTVVVAAPPGFQVIINSVRRGTTPDVRGFFIKAEYTHIVELWKEEQRVFRQNVALNAGQTKQVDAHRAVRDFYAKEERSTKAELAPAGRGGTGIKTAMATAEPATLERELLTDREAILELNYHLDKQLLFRDLAIVSAVPGLFLAVTGGLLFIDEDARPYNTILLSLGGASMAFSLGGTFAYLFHKTRATSAGGLQSLDGKETQRLLGENARRNRVLGTVLLGVGAGVGVIGSALLGAGETAGKVEQKTWGRTLLMGSAGYVVASIPLFVLYGIYKKKQGTNPGKRTVSSRFLVPTPALLPNVTGAVLGIRGTF